MYIYAYVYVYVFIVRHDVPRRVEQHEVAAYIYIYVYTCVYIYVYTCIYTYMYMYIHIYIYMHMYVYVYVFIVRHDVPRRVEQHEVAISPSEPADPGADVGGGEPSRSRRRCGRGWAQSFGARMGAAAERRAA